MAGSRIETFWGAPDDDAKLFIKQVKYAFAGKKQVFDENPEDFDDARITALISNTTGEARKWIRGLDDDVSGDWDKLTKALDSVSHDKNGRTSRNLRQEN